MSLLRSRVLLAALALGVAASGLASYLVASTDATDVAVSDVAVIEGGQIEGAYAFDVSDKRRLVGFADNAFVGRVVERVGTDDPASVELPTDGRVASEDEQVAAAAAGIVSTQFSVEVLENIKGKLEGTVTVSQVGGQVEYAADRDYPELGVEKGQRVRELLLSEGDPLLQPGQEVLFVTGHNREKNRHEIVANGFGDLRIKDKKDRAEKVAKFKDAEKNAIDPRGE